jgi:hypothetical protein
MQSQQFLTAISICDNNSQYIDMQLTGTEGQTDKSSRFGEAFELYTSITSNSANSSPNVLLCWLCCCALASL